MNYQIDKDSDTPLYIQIRQHIETAVQDGVLSPGDRLPSVAGLAKEIGVTQATVRRALQDLTDSGLAYCHVGRGTFICDPKTAAGSDDNQSDEAADELFSHVSAPLHQRGRLHGQRSLPTDTPIAFAARKLRSSITSALKDIVGLATRPGIIQFTKGIPDPALLPEGFLNRHMTHALERDGDSLLESTEPVGRYELRQEIARRASTPHCTVSPEQVLITNGSIQAITLLAQDNLEIGLPFYSETPCFRGMTDSFSAMGHWVETTIRDLEGPSPVLPEGGPAMLYLCPYGHNPTGLNLSAERSAYLCDWARRNGSVLIADEIFRELCISENPQPSLLEKLGKDQTVVISSLSKSIATGFRLGWLISSEQRVQRLARLKHLMDNSCPTLSQAIGLSIFQSGEFDSHTEATRAVYKKRCSAMLSALKRTMPEGVRWSRPDCGFSMMLELPAGYSSISLFLGAVERGVAFLPGPLFDIDQRFINCCRISYAWADESTIKEGIELLGDAVNELLRRPPGDSGLSLLGSFQ